MASRSKRIQMTLQTASNSARKLLSSYITAGDPKPEATVPLLHQLVESGVDILELGIPFTDPMAEGPVIQAAMQRALNHKVTIQEVLGYVKAFRQKDQTTPVVLMGYLNPIEIMGYANFVEAAEQAGVDGLIIVDLPPEEADELVSCLQSHTIDLICLFSPTTTAERLSLLQKVGSGYLYYVAVKGVTGAGYLDTTAVAKSLSRHQHVLHLPIMIGFGIKSPQQAADVSQLADGVVVGSALIEHIVEHPDLFDETMVWMQSIRQALDKGNVHADKEACNE